ncbi:MAG: copper chaperone PCu(A)C [Burkholderiaceae bacterium]
MNFRYFLTTTLCLISLGTQAKTTADGAWARATVPGQNMGGAFITLTSDQDATLIGASSPVSEKMELHTMKMEGEKMVMAQVSSIPLPANTQVELKPGSLHLMFMGLKQPLTEGQNIAITLKIKLSSGHVETLSIQAPVKSLAHSAMHQ